MKKQKYEIKKSEAEPTDEYVCSECGGEPNCCDLCNSDGDGGGMELDDFYCLEGIHLCKNCKRIVENFVASKLFTLKQFVNRMRG
jgi:hypothetical protein